MKEKRTDLVKHWGVCGVLAVYGMLVLHYRIDLINGEYPGQMLRNFLDKWHNCYYDLGLRDLYVFILLSLLFDFVSQKKEPPKKGAAMLSLVLGFLFVVCKGFMKYNSAVALFGYSFQTIMALFCTVGYGFIIFAALKATEIFFSHAAQAQKRERRGKIEGTWFFQFLDRHLFLAGFLFLFASWLFWLVFSYPGTDCPDGILQLQQYLGEVSPGQAHPPLSTWIMGITYSVGKALWDANFGFFLYCFLQTVTGSLVFSLSVKKARDMGFPLPGAVVFLLFFALTPLWGTYAQWREKDLLYTEAVVFHTVCFLDVYRKKAYGKKEAALLISSALLAVFLRNNGIYPVFASIVLLGIHRRKREGKLLLLSAVAVFLVYEGMTKLVFPAMGIAKVSGVAESFSIPFQQTARYVVEHPEDVTEYEREVLDETFGYEYLFGYDPVISDPIKIHYWGTPVGKYLGVWFRMFFKHPGSYLSAFVNICYGYLAPVSQNIEAWIQLDYYTYSVESGIYHPLGREKAEFLAYIWYQSMHLPVVKYLCTPGFYTWIVIFLSYILAERKKYPALILFVPSYVNILVCIASPLASAIRYQLPTVASVPLLIGFAYAERNDT